MAVIECVLNYDEKTGEVSVVTHVLSLDASDKIQFVTQTPGFTLKSEDGFEFLGLHAGDLAPIRYTTAIRPTDGVPMFKVYYHGPMGKFACGELDNRNAFQSWPRGVGVPAPSGGSGI